MVCVQTGLTVVPAYEVLSDPTVSQKHESSGLNTHFYCTETTNL